MNCKQCKNQSRPNIYWAASISGLTWITALQTCELFSSYSAGYDMNVQATFWYYSIKTLLKPRTRRNSIKVEASTLHMLARCKNIAQTSYTSYFREDTLASAAANQCHLVFYKVSSILILFHRTQEIRFEPMPSESK